MYIQGGYFSKLLLSIECYHVEMSFLYEAQKVSFVWILLHKCYTRDLQRKKNLQFNS